MNLRDSLSLMFSLFQAHLDRSRPAYLPSRHPGSKRPKLSKVASRGRHKRQRQARKVQRRAA
jgi:hypothetical protein